MANVICFDIDGVLTEEADTKHADLAGTYIYRSPNYRARDLMARAYSAGYYVLLYTGRREAHRRLTEDWLHSHGFHYHRLEMGKPYFSYFIDDRILGASVDDQLDALAEMIRDAEAEQAGREER